MENQNKSLKFNYRNTLYIGCAFFSILMVWQVYNHYCPLFLDYLLRSNTKLALVDNERLYIIGIIMAADNLLAIFMLPIFGTLSDKTKSKYGRRMPYIIIGMFLSAICFPLIAVMFISNNLVGLIIIMAIILIIMNMYRNPAVALMPDVTPKPLRSKANGIINFVGYLGAILAGGLAMFLKITDSSASNWIPTASGKTNAILAFAIASFFLLLAMIILILKINENKLVKETEADLALGETLSETHGDVSENAKLNTIDKRNVLILLFAIFFWYMAFNALETFNSLFCKNVLNNESAGGTIVIILTVSSIITFLATVNLPTKIGRKRAVIVGILALLVGFAIIVLHLVFAGVFKSNFDSNSTTISIIPIYIAIVFCGFGWALINANSYPMLVEMANKSNVGKYTGYYYTFSMGAQAATPILIGIIMSLKTTGLRILYIYSFILIIIALVTFLFYQEKKTNRNEIITKKGFSALDVDD